MAKPSKRQVALAIVDLTNNVSEAKLARAIAAYLVAERRSNELDAILREVKRLRQQKTGVVEATITTAFPASAAVRAEIKRLLGKNIIMNETVDKSVIGGVRVETNDHYLDLTVRNRLDKLKLGVTS